MLTKLAKRFWILLVFLLTIMFEHMVVTYLNKLLVAHTGPVASAGLSVLHWLTKTGTGVMGTLVLAVTIGLVVYTYVESKTEAKETSNASQKPKREKPKASRKRPPKKNFFSERFVPILVCVAIITVVALAIMGFFESRRAIITLDRMPLLVNPNIDKYAANIEMGNVGDHAARRFYLIGGIYEEPSVSDGSELDAMSQFAPRWRSKKMLAPVEQGDVDAHQHVAISVIGNTMTQEKNTKFRNGELVFVVLGTASFEDDAGYHEKNVCGTIRFDSLLISCHHHNDGF